MLLLVLSIKLIIEIALAALSGQLALALLAGATRDRNAIYRLLALLTHPFVAATRRIMPRLVIDRHLPLVTLLLLSLMWMAATAAKVAICLKIGLAACR